MERPHRVPRSTVLFLVVAAVLSSTVDLKIASIQYLEVITLAQILVLLSVFVHNGFQVRLAWPVAVLDAAYLGIALLAMAFSLLSLQQNFYVPPDFSLLRMPAWVSLSRVLELVLDVFLLSFVAEMVRRDRSLFRRIGRLYFWTGAVSAVYSIAKFVLHAAMTGSVEISSASSRMKGFYNEGGPYGLYLVSVIFMGWALWRERLETMPRLLPAFGVLALAFVGSRSKAAFLMLTLMGFLMAMGMRRWWLKGTLLTAIVIVSVVVATLINIPAELRAYRRGAQAYERLSLRSSHDGNFIAGRVAATFIVPRMVAARPWTGVGWGHYGLVRNNSEYRGASAFVPNVDLPGLGILDYFAELGIPLTLLLMATLLLPYVYLRNTGAPIYLQRLALVQPLVHLFGAQLNLTYPWVVTGLALGLGWRPVEGDAAASYVHALPKESFPVAAR